MRVFFKTLTLNFLAWQPLTDFRLQRIRQAGWVTVLNLHRVSEYNDSAYEALRPEFFRYLLEFACKHFRPTTFGNLARTLSKPGKPPIILSFDDGYQDFYDISVPMAESYGVSLNQNIIPSCIDSGMPPLNVLAQDFVGQAEFTTLRGLQVPGLMVDVDRSNRKAFAAALSRYIKYQPQAQQRELAKKLVPQFMQDGHFRPTRMMTREQVRTVAVRHEVGAHSFDHATMEFESLDYFRADVRRCADYFLHHIGIPMKVYAFPNGSYNSAQVEYLRTSGVDHVLLVGERINSNASGVHHRLTFHAHSAPEVRFRASGAWFAVMGNLARS